tara:strand:+ start:141 stop:401 length:261 start_codon:yes stop_codon:yes gene_type:complete
MAKYYVECGEIKDVLNASNPMDACVCSIVRRMKYNLKNNKEQHCNLQEMFTINEKGFVSERSSSTMNSIDEEFIDIKIVFEELNKI